MVGGLQNCAIQAQDEENKSSAGSAGFSNSHIVVNNRQSAVRGIRPTSSHFGHNGNDLELDLENNRQIIVPRSQTVGNQRQLLLSEHHRED